MQAGGWRILLISIRVTGLDIPVVEPRFYPNPFGHSQWSRWTSWTYITDNYIAFPETLLKQETFLYAKKQVV